MPTSTSTTSDVIRVGIVGTGSVAQVVHLPTLLLLSHLYKVVALSDVSPGSLQYCGEKFGILKDMLFANSEDLVKHPDVDLVVILCSDEFHVEVAIQAANAKKNVLIEKPMALTHEDGKAIIQARDKNGVIMAVGYMRRYAPAFLQACEIVKGMKDIRYARVRDIIGWNRLSINQSGTFSKAFSDVPAEASAALVSRAKKITQSALGVRASDERLARLYRLLNGLSSHDLSAMRELLGMPKRVLGAHLAASGEFFTVLFEYDGGFCCTFETGIDDVGVFDAHLEVYGGGKRVKVEYDTPFIKGLPTTLTIGESDAKGAYSERVIRPTYEDNFTLEYLHLHEIFSKGSAQNLKLTPEDALQDLVLFDMIIEAVAKNL